MLITTIRQIPLPTHPPPRVLGVDDSALRKGVRYGAALVDLEEHRLIDLLPDRTAESLAAWLQAHPGVAIITRDRNETYATGARQGAPDAIQVADRWHLLANWREVMVRLFERHRGPVKQVTTAQPRPLVAPAETLLPPKRVNRRRKYAEQRRAQVHAQRLARYAAVRGRYQAGAYLTTIARELKLNYKTARKYALADECPQLKAYPPRQRLLAPYEPYLRALGGWLSQRDAALP